MNHIRLKLYNGKYRVTPVKENGQLPEFPYDIRNAHIHPCDAHILESLKLPEKLHRNNYE